MTHRKTLLALSALLLAAAPAVATASNVVPYTRMAASELAPDGYAHHAVLRIDQDFHPNDDYEIAIDAWVADDKPDSLTAVRMWWLDTSDADARSPFGRGVRRHIDIDYDQTDEGWDIRIKQGRRKAYVFAVELTDGKAVASATVKADGQVIEDCKVKRSRLVAKKVLGIPTGLKRINVTCTDAEGTQHKGSVMTR
jgi:hypothetical protein